MSGLIENITEEWRKKMIRSQAINALKVIETMNLGKEANEALDMAIRTLKDLELTSSLIPRLDLTATEWKRANG